MWASEEESARECKWNKIVCVWLPVYLEITSRKKTSVSSYTILIRDLIDLE